MGLNKSVVSGMLTVVMLSMQSASGTSPTVDSDVEFPIVNNIFGQWKSLDTSPLRNCSDSLQNCTVDAQVRLSTTYKQLFEAPTTQSILDNYVFPYLTAAFPKRANYLLSRYKFVKTLFDVDNATVFNATNASEAFYGKASNLKLWRSLNSGADESRANVSAMQAEVGVLNTTTFNNLENVNTTMEEKKKGLSTEIEDYAHQTLQLLEDTTNILTTLVDDSVQSVSDKLMDALSNTNQMTVEAEAKIQTALNDSEYFQYAVANHSADAIAVFEQLNTSVFGIVGNVSSALSQLGGNIQAEYSNQLNSALTTLQTTIFDPRNSSLFGLIEQADANLTSDISAANSSAYAAKAAHSANNSDAWTKLNDTVSTESLRIEGQREFVRTNESATAALVYGNLSIVSGNQTTFMAAVNSTMVTVATALDKVVKTTADGNVANAASAQKVARLFDNMMTEVMTQLITNVKSGSGSLGASLGIHTEAVSDAITTLNGTFAAGSAAAKDNNYHADLAAAETTAAKFAQLAELLVALENAKKFMQAAVGAAATKTTADVENVNEALSASATDLSSELADVASQEHQSNLKFGTDGLDASFQAQQIAEGLAEKVGKAADESEEKSTAEYNDTVHYLSEVGDQPASNLETTTTALQGTHSASQDAASAVNDFVGDSKSTMAGLVATLKEVLAGIDTTLEAMEDKANSSFFDMTKEAVNEIGLTKTNVTGVVNQAAAAFRVRLSESNSVSAGLMAMADNLLERGPVQIEQADSSLETMVKTIEDQVPSVLTNQTVKMTQIEGVYSGKVVDATREYSESIEAWKSGQLETTSKALDTAYNVSTGNLEDAESSSSATLVAAVNSTLTLEQVVNGLDGFSGASGDFSTSAEESLSQQAVRLAEGKKSSKDEAEYIDNMVNSLAQLAQQTYTDTLQPDLKNLTTNYREIVSAGIDSGAAVAKNIKELGSKASNLSQVITNLHIRRKADNTKSERSLNDTINGLVSDINLAKTKAETDMVKVTQADAIRSRDFLDILDIMRNAQLSSLGGLDEKNLLLAGRLKQASLAISDFGGSLDKYIEASHARIKRDSQIETAKAENLAKVTVAAEAQTAESAGKQMLAALDFLDSNTESSSAAHGRFEAGVLDLARQMHALGADSAASMRELLERLASGEITMNEAFDAITKIDAASIDTVEEAAGALVSMMNIFSGKINFAVQKASDSLNTFASGFPEKFTSLRNTAVAAANELGTMENSIELLKTAQGLLLNKMVNDSQNAWKMAEANATSIAAGVSDTIAALTASKTRARSKLADLRKEESAQIGSAIASTVESIRKLFKLKSGSTLDIDNISWTV